MPEVREVFEMSTQKIKPDQGYVERQHDHQRTTERRRKVGAFVVVAAISLVAIVMIVATRSTGTTSAPAGTSPSSVSAPAPGQPFLIDLGTGTETPLAGDIRGGVFYSASPDGTRIVYGQCCTSQDVVTIANIDGTGAHAITPTQGLDAYGPAWSPDGTKVVYQLRNASTHEFGSLVVQDVVTGLRKTKVATIRGSNGWWFLSPTFSPDGSTLLFQVPRDLTPRNPSGWDTWSVPATGGTPTRALPDAGFARYFPDGKRIVFVAGMKTATMSGTQISIADADGTRHVLAKAQVAVSRPEVSPDGSKVAYVDGGSIYVVDVSTGRSTNVGTGSSAAWLDNGTLIVSPPRS
jgi:Tol biopolymer transport system component